VTWTSSQFEQRVEQSILLVQVVTEVYSDFGVEKRVRLHLLKKFNHRACKKA
jgi:hypothetical protein